MVKSDLFNKRVTKHNYLKVESLAL